MEDETPKQEHGASWIAWLGSGLAAVGVLWLCFVTLQPNASQILHLSIKGEFWHQLSKQQESGQLSIPVSSLVGFEWDTLCMFYGYGDAPTKILIAHGIDDIPPPHKRRAQTTENKSDIVFFAFALKGRVVESFIENASVYMNGFNHRIKLEDECVHKTEGIVRVEGAGNSRTLIFTEQRKDKR